MVSCIVLADLPADLALRPPRRVHIGIGRTRPYRAHGLVEGARLDALSCRPDDVSGSDDARDHCLRGFTSRTCGLAPTSPEASDDATAHVLVGEGNVRNGRGVL